MGDRNLLLQPKYCEVAAACRSGFPGGPSQGSCPIPVPGAKGWRPKSKNFANPVHIPTPYRDPIQPVREGEVQGLLGPTSGSEKCTGFS